MYSLLLPLHSLFRWLLLLSLIYAICIALSGYLKGWTFHKNHDRTRHWTATIAHIQLIFGILIYTKSAMVKSLFSSTDESVNSLEPLFFGLIHISCMLIAIVLITIGSAKAKREHDSHAKFKTMLVWFLAAFLLIVLAIPWPFSPLASRPYFRNY